MKNRLDRSKFFLGTYILQPYARTEAHIKDLADAGIDVEYIYAFVSRDKDKAYVIIRTEKSTRAAEVLVQNGVEILTEEALYNM